jgi:pseudaminic acid cytidylyltransferase
MKNLAVIPARGGSKRIPGKNLRAFLGKPILAYSILTAQQSGLFDDIMVSTDSDEIAGVARWHGAAVPFRRSAEKANDHATLAEVLMEVVQEYEKRGRTFENVCCLLPTAPLITPHRIQEAYALLVGNHFTSVCPVVGFSSPIWRGLKIDENGHLRMIWPEHLKSRSQDLPRAYHDSGSFYWVKADALRAERTLFCAQGAALILSEMEAQDIDTEADWHLAELKYTHRHAQ